jgi:hypothetical protein
MKVENEQLFATTDLKIFEQTTQAKKGRVRGRVTFRNQRAGSTIKAFTQAI